MTRQSKGYLKLGIGALIILSKLAGPKPYFWSWETAEGVGYNVGVLFFIGLALWLMLSGIKDIRNS